MKNSFLVFVAFILSVTTTHAQWWAGNEKITGNGDMVTKNRTTPAYEKISLTGSMEVQLIAGTEGKLKVEAESNLQEYIVTEVEGGTLKISTEKGYSLNPSRRYSIKVIVPFEEIEGVAVTGSGDIWNSDEIRATNFSTHLTGSGDIKLNIDAEVLDGTITGSGDINLAGSAQSFSCKVTGSGDFQAYDLRAEEVEARVSGSGDIEVYATQILTARVLGSGDIFYRGNPERENFKTTGSGSVSSR